MKDYVKRFMIALLMGVCVSLLMIGGGLAQSKSEKKQSQVQTGDLEGTIGMLHTSKAA
ncbi:hypothetical protein [Pseudobacillus wudalianchiensis]|uniref:hypothetical protein n=1 Tax=Pseudobacillus wudalianchiensis TaxID=1743143 RepID=UPI00159F0758|nr:hypothetical protein [Bacillus wudalianchiensis]